MAARFSKPGQWGHGIAEMRGEEPRWTGLVELDESKLALPLKWRSPRCVFVNSTSDLFHERIPDEAIDRVFAVMAVCPQHRFIVLTKRAERMRSYHSMARAHPVGLEALGITVEEVAKNQRSTVGEGVVLRGDIARLKAWPLRNVILGVSTEDQATADERIPHLLATPAACRMVSAEPLLGPVDLSPWLGKPWCPTHDFDGGFCIQDCGDWRRLEWIVTGGESGPNARPAHPDWFRAIRDQCQAAGVAYFHKQWGEYSPGDCGEFQRVGKHRAGRLLDGREWTEFPDV